jgi:hypothetical protein
MTGYNGWKNKETWLVNLWLGDELAMMQEDGYSIGPDAIEELVREYIGGFDGKSVENGFLIDMLNCALGEIDYRELAANYADTLEGEDE